MNYYKIIDRFTIRNKFLFIMGFFNIYFNILVFSS